jgi:hypothetical protein
MRPRAIKVVPIEHYRLQVTFGNEEVRIFDVKPYLEFKGFDILRDPNIFNTVHVSGLSVEWVSGHDICPDELYYNSRSM